MSLGDVVGFLIFGSLAFWFLWCIIGAVFDSKRESKEWELEELVAESKKYDLPWPEHNDLSVTDSMATHITDRMRAKDKYSG
jgi:hypothetical protein